MFKKLYVKWLVWRGKAVESSTTDEISEDLPKEESICEIDEDGIYVTGLTFCSDERGITCKGHPVLEKLSIHPIGEGMLWIGNSCGPLYYANSYKGIARQLLDGNSNLVGFEEMDFDWDKLKEVEHPYDLNRRHVGYGGLGRYNDFRDGVCCLCWMLYPDGRYFADEDGFGMEDNDEENIYCIIDSNLRIVITWQPMTDEEMATKMREAKEIAVAHKSNTDNHGEICSSDLEKKALQFVSKIDSIIEDGSQESIDSLFSVLDCLTLKPGFRLGLKIAARKGIGDESWFYTYQEDEASDAIGDRVMPRRMIFDDIIVEQSAMGAWQAYLLYIAPTIMPTWWHGGYICREFFFDRDHYRGITSNWGRKDVDIKLSQIPQPTVEMKEGKAVVSCPYWNDWQGLVLEKVDVEFKSDGTIALNSHSKVLYKYDCGVCF